MREIGAAWKILRSGLFRRRMPWSVTFGLTHRCTAHCSYCAVVRDKREEMPTVEVINAIDSFYSAGMVRLGLTGGEAVLREDLPEIIRHAHTKDLYITLNTSGALLTEHGKDLRGIHSLVVGLNGDKQDQESTREGTNHKEALEAIDWASANKINVMTISALTSDNLAAIPYILDLAKRKGFWATFQPVIPYGEQKNSTQQIGLSKEQMDSAIQALFRAKKDGYPVANTRRYLKYMQAVGAGISQPQTPCLAGLNFCTVLPDGVVVPCYGISFRKDIPFLNGREVGWLHAFEEMPSYQCDDPCPGPYFELNSLLSMKPDVWLGWAALSIKNRLFRRS